MSSDNTTKNWTRNKKKKVPFQIAIGRLQPLYLIIKDLSCFVDKKKWLHPLIEIQKVMWLTIYYYNTIQNTWKCFFLSPYCDYKHSLEFCKDHWISYFYEQQFFFCINFNNEWIFPQLYLFFIFLIYVILIRGGKFIFYFIKILKKKEKEKI